MSLHPGGAQSRWPFDGGGRAMGAGALVPTTVAICPLVDLGFRLHTFTRDSPRRCLTHCQPRCSRDRMLSGTFSAFETRLKSASAHCDFRESQRPDGSAGGALGLHVLLGLPHPSRSPAAGQCSNFTGDRGLQGAPRPMRHGLCRGVDCSPLQYVFLHPWVSHRGQPRGVRLRMPVRSLRLWEAL